MMHKLSCLDIQDLYTEYVDDTLSHEVYSQIQDHLVNCTPCQILYKQLDQILEETHNLPTVQTSTDFIERLNSRIHQPDLNLWQRVYTSSFAKVGTYAAAAGFVMAILFTQYMEPLPDSGLQDSKITQNPAPQTGHTALAVDVGDSSMEQAADSITLEDPTRYIDSQQFQLVNDSP